MANIWQNLLLVKLIFITFSTIEGADYNFFCADSQFCSFNANILTCSKGFNQSYFQKSSEVEVLILCNWFVDILDLSNILTIFNRVQNIQIRQSYISYISGNSSLRYESLKELNISNVNLKNLSLPHLTSLTSLDISYNIMDKIKKEHLCMMPRLRNLYMAGNPINCRSSMQWLLDVSQNSFVQLVDEKETFCVNDDYKGKPVLGIMKLFQRMEEDCPLICKCSLDKVVGDLMPIISVNCNNLSLTQFPEKVPTNTTVLLLKHNKISNVLPLVSDKQYWDVKDVYLDYNLISTIDGLEDSYWLNNFRVFSLRGNSITQVQTYSLDNAFEYNQHLISVYFGFNPWKCDCSFTPGFRELILKYLEHMKDVNNIQCAIQEDDDNSMLPIAELPITAYCVDHSLPLNPLDYLSITFATLTLLILGKLLYDWWHFKRTGKVPWIVAHMP